MAVRLPHEQFLETFKWAPRLAICVHVEDEGGAVALAQRSIEPAKGSWHYPGSFLLRDEPLHDCIVRILKSELGLERTDFVSELAGVFENLRGDPRGHVIDVVYRIRFPEEVSVKSTAETQRAAFFSRIPPHMAFGHDSYLESLGMLRAKAE